MTIRRTVSMTLLAAVLVPALPAADGAWRIGSGDVKVVCPLTVGGSFEARTGALTGSVTPGPDGYGGSLQVDLRTLDTGIGLRNSHMRDRYLEVHRGEDFAQAVLSDLRLSQPEVASTGGRTTFRASLLVHGVRREIEGVADLSRRGADVRVQASFPLTLTEFEIPSPRYLGVGVRDRITVHVSFVGSPAS